MVEMTLFLAFFIFIPFIFLLCLINRLASLNAFFWITFVPSHIRKQLSEIHHHLIKLTWLIHAFISGIFTIQVATEDLKWSPSYIFRWSTVSTSLSTITNTRPTPGSSIHSPTSCRATNAPRPSNFTASKTSFTAPVPAEASPSCPSCSNVVSEMSEQKIMTVTSSHQRPFLFRGQFCEKKSWLKITRGGISQKSFRISFILFFRTVKLRFSC